MEITPNVKHNLENISSLLTDEAMYINKCIWLHKEIDEEYYNKLLKIQEFINS